MVDCLLTDVELISVRLDHGAVVKHDIVADSSLCHLTTDRLTLTLRMQFALLYSIIVALYNFIWDGGCISVIYETFW